jgi:hypothetical protein
VGIQFLVQLPQLVEEEERDMMEAVHTMEKLVVRVAEHVMT